MKPEHISNISVIIRRYENGYYAVSDDLPGLFVAAQTEEQVMRDIPVAIGLLLKAIHGGSYDVRQTGEGMVH